MSIRKSDKIDPDTADLEELRAMPYLMDAICLSQEADRKKRCTLAWERAVNALMRTVPL